MSKNQNYVIWMLSVAFFALVVGQLIISPGEVDRTPKVSSHSHNRARGRQVAKPPVQAKPADKGQQSSAAAAGGSEKVDLSSYSQLVNLISEKPATIEKVKFVNGKNAVEVTLTGGKPARTIVIPGAATQSLLASLGEAGINVEASDAPPAGGGLSGFLSNWGPAILIGGIILFVAMRRTGGGIGGKGGFGNSKAKSLDKLGDSVERVSFDDVAGCDEAVRELKRIVYGLVDPDVYRHFGAERPSGILLEGPPGTGKTMLAKAVATACNGTMDIVSGSDFVEMFVGVGAARVRDMVAKGQANVKRTGKPHIIFIDEIDAIGGKRGSGTSINRNDEREQTLNAILVAMDGVEATDGIIWMAATNRADMLDDALLRPGRFDSQVKVDLPDKAGRAKIFAIHSRGKPLAAECTFEKLAIRTYGYSGAQIKLACNRAALLAAERWAEKNKHRLKERKGNWSDRVHPEAREETYGLAMGGFATTRVVQPSVSESKKALEQFELALCKGDPDAVVTLADFDEAIDFVVYGDANTSRQTAMRQDEKKNTAYHEAGHAVVAEAMPGADPVAKITIMSRSKALGYVQQVPADDRFSMTDRQLVSRMVMAMAGRAAQEVYLKTCDTGAQNDFEQATDIARRMVTEWGMSRLGHIAVGGRTSIGRRGANPGSGPGYGPDLANAIDAEWRRIVDACANLALQIVRKEKERMEKVVAVLMDKETILKDEWYDLMQQVPSALAEGDAAFDPRAPEKKEGEDGR